MKTLQELIKDLTGITVEQPKITNYLANKSLDLADADLRGADLWGIKITKKQLDQLTIIEGDK